MARTRCRPRPTQAKFLTPVATYCPECGHLLRTTRCKYRTVTTLDAATRLSLRIRCCPNPDCSRYHRRFCAKFADRAVTRVTWYDRRNGQGVKMAPSCRSTT